MSRRVLQMGPPPSSVGGMAEVATLLAAAEATTAAGFVAPLVDSGGGRGLRGYVAFPAALRRAAAGDYDLLHLHVASGGSVLRKAVLAEAARALGRPYVVHLHGGGFQRFLDTGPTWQVRRAHRLFLGASQVVVLGRRWQEVVATMGVPTERITVVPNGVAPPVVTPVPYDERRREVTFVGGLTRAKGVDLLLDAIREKAGAPAWEGWRFVLIGPKTDPEIDARITALNTAHPGVLECPGPLFGGAKAQRVAHSSVFVLPSRAEGLPLVVLEAMACGVPAVASDVGSTAEVITDGADGLVVPAGDRRSLTAALDRVISDACLRRALGESARLTWETHFAAEIMAARMAEVWDRTLSRELS